MFRFVRRVVPVLLLLASNGHAAEFQLSPTRVQLDPQHLVDTVVVGNSGTTPLRFEVSVQRWRMAADGHWDLAPSDDLIVHPLLLDIAPGGKGRVRVGQLAPSQDPAESAYRIQLDEQPNGPQQANRVRMLTRISLPVFVHGGVAGVPKASVDSPQWRGDSLAVALHNDGQGYLPPQALDVQLRAGNGAVLAEQALQGNYVLAGAALPLRMRMPQALCARASELTVHLRETGTQLHLPLVPRHCQP